MLFCIYPILCTSIFTCFLLLVTVVKGIGLKRQSYFCSLVLEFFLSYSISYPIVPYAPGSLHSFLLVVKVVNGIDPKRH